MRYHVAVLLIFVFGLAASSPAAAQWLNKEKWELAPYVGFETAASFPINTSATFDRLRVESGLSYGLYLDYSLTDNSQAEFMWNRNNTSFSARSASTQTYSKAFNSDIDQYEFGFLYMFRNSEQKLRPFAAGGIGFTHESNDGRNPNRTSLSFGLGGGAKYIATKHFSLRGDLRWLPTRASKTPGITCDAFGNCFRVNVSHYLQRVNLTGGIAFRF
jgi:hypothetical protein